MPWILRVLGRLTLCGGWLCCAMVPPVLAQSAPGTAAVTTTGSPSSGGGIRITTNKPDGRFVEDERLVLTIVSDIDGYLKLDYYQADSTVVHIVPNLVTPEVRVKAGEPYVFGGGDTPPYLVVQAPYGHETIKAMVSPQPWQADRNPTNSEGDGLGDSNNRRGVTRGGRLVIGSEGSISIVTVSKVPREDRGIPK